MAGLNSSPSSHAHVVTASSSSKFPQTSLSPRIPRASSPSSSRSLPQPRLPRKKSLGRQVVNRRLTSLVDVFLRTDKVAFATKYLSGLKRRTRQRSCLPSQLEKMRKKKRRVLQFFRRIKESESPLGPQPFQPIGIKEEIKEGR